MKEQSLRVGREPAGNKGAELGQSSVTCPRAGGTSSLEKFCGKEGSRH